MVWDVEVGANDLACMHAHDATTASQLYVGSALMALSTLSTQQMLPGAPAACQQSMCQFAFASL
jgi:hypothetical protein